MRKILALLVAAMILVSASSVVYANHASNNTDDKFIHESRDGRDYRIYVPSGHGDEELPMVVMLHGCEQTPEEFAEATRMNQVAEREGFIAVYPEQPRTENINRCWNWFDDYNQERGQGEPASIKRIIDEVSRDYSVDEDRVYAAGMSAGGAMAVILGATYPDTFAAVASHSGLEYGAADNAFESTNALYYGGPNPDHQGYEAYREMSQKSMVPAIVFHGDDDLVSRPVNAHQTAEQWIQTNDLASDGRDDGNIDDEPEKVVEKESGEGEGYVRYVYEDSRGNTVVEKYIVDDMGHEWSGAYAYEEFTEPDGPPASEIIWNFFESV